MKQNLSSQLFELRNILSGMSWKKIVGSSSIDWSGLSVRLIGLGLTETYLRLNAIIWIADCFYVSNSSKK